MGELDHIYMRQLRFFDPSIQNLNLHLFGAGSVGSFLALNLAKLGFNDLNCYDYDLIEEHNLPNQFYKYNQVGQKKLDALKETIKEFTDIDINVVDGEITKENVGSIAENINLQSLIVLSFDNLEARKIVYESVKGYPNKLLDIRMGGKGWEMFIIDLDNEEQCKIYEESLEKETVSLPCGEQSIIFTLLNIASEVSNIIVKINNEQDHVIRLRRHMDSYLFIHSGKEEEPEEDKTEGMVEEGTKEEGEQEEKE